METGANRTRQLIWPSVASGTPRARRYGFRGARELMRPQPEPAFDCVVNGIYREFNTTADRCRNGCRSGTFIIFGGPFAAPF